MTTKKIEDVVAEKVEEFKNQIIASEPVQRLLSIEYRALASGREEEYGDGEILSDVLTKSLTQLVKEVEEGERKRIFNCIEGMKTSKPYRSWLTTEYTNYKNILEKIQEEITQPNKPN